MAPAPGLAVWAERWSIIILFSCVQSTSPMQSMWLPRNLIWCLGIDFIKLEMLECSLCFANVSLLFGLRGAAVNWILIVFTGVLGPLALTPSWNTPESNHLSLLFKGTERKARAESEENYSVQLNYKWLHKSNPFGKLQHYQPVNTSIKNKEIQISMALLQSEAPLLHWPIASRLDSVQRSGESHMEEAIIYSLLAFKLNSLLHGNYSHMNKCPWGCIQHSAKKTKWCSGGCDDWLAQTCCQFIIMSALNSQVT